MGLLDRLKAMLGISAAEIDIVLPGGAVALGRPIDGQVVLRGGRVEQHVRALSIEVIGRVTTPVNPSDGAVPEDFVAADKVPEAEAPFDQASAPVIEDDGQAPIVDDTDEAEQEETTIASVTLAEDLNLGARETKTFDFSLDLGDAAEPSSPSVQWVLLARADIPAAVDARKWQRVEIE